MPNKPGIKAVLAILASAITLGTVSAQTLDLRIAVKASALLIAEDGRLESDPAPLYTPIGLSANFGMGSGFEIEPTIDLYAGYYLYSDQLKRALAAAYENRSALVFGCIVGFPVGYRVRLVYKGRLRVFLGPAVDLRLCVTADGLRSDEQSAAETATKAISKYFWNNFQWLLPTAGIGIDFPYTEKLALGAELRIWLPVSRLWTSKSLQFWDNTRAALSLRLSFL